MSSDKITVYYSSISYDQHAKKSQQRVRDILEKDYNIEFLDLATGENGKLSDVREKCGDKTAKPPLIFNGDVYCGNYDAFDEAVEDKCIKKFLKLE